jgi:hypothetical protein
MTLMDGRAYNGQRFVVITLLRAKYDIVVKLRSFLFKLNIRDHNNILKQYYAAPSTPKLSQAYTMGTRQRIETHAYDFLL